ncbi:hypothetical protein [uncultured Muribaculum sp.]|uniref:hypothetical protein n=1 Tax=uncultured Muribaculum sp. TaxID=1918613 RepID=UPI00262CCA51|nr:hypothetical protein [uncultured Muribaculum sp.]
MSRLYKISILAFPIFVLTAIAGCSADPTVEEKIEAARDYIETSNYEPAQTICDRLRTQLYDNPVSANATTLAELSLLYMRLADADDRQDNIGLAYSCYEEAFRMDSASAAAFYTNTSVDDLPLVSILNSIASIASRRGKIQDYTDEPDSVSVNMSTNH